MSTDLSRLPGIGELALKVFNRAKFQTIGDVRSFVAGDRLLMEAIADMKATDPIRPTSYWRRLLSRCINIVYNIQNRSALPFVPDQYMCPISLDLMNDPVIAPSGYSYERAEIVEWISQYGSDPYTRQSLTMDQLYPNRALQTAIIHYRRNFHIYSISIYTN